MMIEMHENGPSSGSRVIAVSLALKRWLRSWRNSAGLPAVVVCLALAFIFGFLSPTHAGFNAILGAFNLLRENLPLTLPILSATLSIMLNIRQLLEPHGWIKLPTPISLGLVSFSIWYVVATQTIPDQYVPIGTQKVINRDFAVVLVVMAFIWAAFTAVCRAIAEGTVEENRGWLWYTGQAFLLFISVVALCVPFFLFETKSAVEARLKRSLDESSFSVAIPYRDPSLTVHLARTADPIMQAVVYSHIRARTANEAIGAARKRFEGSEQSKLQYPTASPRAVVEIIEAWIVAEKEPAGAR
jgi:hypothetical protein